MSNSDSASDLSDPTFQPSIPSPQQESSTQAQRRSQVSSPLIRGSHQNAQQSHSADQQVNSSQSLSPLRPISNRTTSSASPVPGHLNVPSTSRSPVKPRSSHNNKHARLPIHDKKFSPKTSTSQTIQPELASTTRSYHPPQRPNRFQGPASTWRAWTETERNTAASLDRSRAQDLAIHLYNTFALRKRAEIAKKNDTSGEHRGRSRSPSRSASQSRNLSQSKRKGKGKEKAVQNENTYASDSDSHSGSNRSRSKSHSTRNKPPNLDEENPSPDQTQTQIDPETIKFSPPRHWDAWPMPAHEVPRPSLFPSPLTSPRKRKHTYPSMELEECLLAVTTRAAKVMWEKREWADRDEEDLRVRKKKKAKIEMGVDMQMQDSTAVSDHETHDDHSSSPSSSSSSSSEGNDIPMFSSQLFTAAPSSPSASPSPPSSSTSTPPRKPVFSADDDHLRTLLLPSTRHVISQFDALLLALHKSQTGRERKKMNANVNIGARGMEEILGFAGLMFGEEVVGRARERCSKLFDLGEG